MIKTFPEKEIYCDCCNKRIAIIRKKDFFTKQFIFTLFGYSRVHEYTTFDSNKGKCEIHLCHTCNDIFFDMVKKELNNEH